MKRYITFAFSSLAAVLGVSCSDNIGDGSGNGFVPEIEITEVTDSSAVLNVSVGKEYENSTYYCGVLPVDEYNAMGGDEAILSMGEQYIPELRRKLQAGNREIKMENLRHNADYYAFAFSLSREGKAGNAVEKEEFRTEVKEYPEFKASITPVTLYPYMATLYFEMENVTDLFTFISVPSSEYEESSQDKEFVQQYFDMIIDANINPDYGIGREDVLKSVIYTGGGGQGNIMYLAPETKYTVILIRLTSEGEVTGFVTKEIETIPMPDSNASIEFSYDKYYDGTYFGFPGNAAVPMEILPDDDAVNWIFSSYRADYTSESSMPDHIAYSMILSDQNAMIDTPYIIYLFPWDTDITLLGFAMDADRQFGKVVRSKLRLSKDGVSDIHDYLAPETAQTVMVAEPSVRRHFVMEMQH